MNSIHSRLARLLERDGYARHLGLELVEAAEGSAAVRMRVQAEHVNFSNRCHGGAIFSLADMALGLACNSYSEGPLAVLIDAHMTVSTSVKEGECLVARASELTRTRKLAVYRMEVTREDGLLVANLTATVYLTDKVLADER